MLHAFGSRQVFFLKGMGKRKFRLGQHQKNEERCLIVSVPRESVSVSVTPFLNISVPLPLYLYRHHWPSLFLYR